ncbi:MAG: hypothetical protein QM784_36370 [Polyangiaceae bacterium]
MPGFEIPTNLPPAAIKVLAPDAPAPLRQMAARGILPGAKPADTLTVVALLAEQQDEAIASQARQTFAKFPRAILDAALAQSLSAVAVHRLALSFAEDESIVERLLRQPDLEQSAVESLAERASERVGELIATNEELMLRFPTAIEKLYLNRSRSHVHSGSTHRTRRAKWARARHPSIQGSRSGNP